MPSQSLSMWFNEASRALDELEVAHRAVGGRGSGRRFATLQVNHAYAVLLSSQFQRFCRDLHSEAVDALTILVPNADLRDIFRAQLTTGRKLDYYDMPTVRRIVVGAAGSDYRFSALVQAVVRSEQFRMRRVGGAGSVARQ